jgi:hypothetical protein
MEKEPPMPLSVVNYVVMSLMMSKIFVVNEPDGVSLTLYHQAADDYMRTRSHFTELSLGDN